MSQAILYEVEEVMSYDRMRRISGLTNEEISEHVAALTEMSTLIDLGAMRPFPIRDVDDWMVLRTAIVGEVDVLCTCDRDLHHPDLDPIYAKAGIEVLTDIDLLQRLGPPA